MTTDNITENPSTHLIWPNNPFHLFDQWFGYAQKTLPMNANAMVLSSIDLNGNPDARVVLLKSFNPNGFVFFTHYNSPKGEQLALHPTATLLFLWNHTPIRQVRIYGENERVTARESDQYFYSRPHLSQLVSSLSPQSQVIPNLDSLTNNLLNNHTDKSITRPSSWGGYRLVPTRIEFWEDRPYRLHERMLYKRAVNNHWHRDRLAP